MITDTGETRRAWPTCNPDGWIASVLLAFLTTAGLYYVNIMPALVAGLQDGLRFSARDAGFVASANVYGAAVGGLVAIFCVRRRDWKRAAALTLALLVAVDLASLLVRSPGAMIAIRFGHGVVGGFLVGVGYSVIARTRSPDRSFGMLMLVQFGLGGVGVMVIPRLVPAYGPGVLFLALVAFSLVTLAMLPFIPRYPAMRAATGPPAEGRVPAGRAWGPLAAALAAVFLFQASAMGLTAYAIGLGRFYGLSTGYVATASGLANWIAAAAAALVIALGVRFGRLAPLLAGLALAIGSRATFYLGHDAGIFFLAATAAAATHAFVLPYLLGLVAAFDKGGQSAAIGGFASKMGLASGPAIGALLLAGQHYDRLIGAAVAGLSLAACVVLWPAWRLDREAAKAAPGPASR